MSSKYDITERQPLGFSGADEYQFRDEIAPWREQSRLQAAVLEAYEAIGKHSESAPHADSPAILGKWEAWGAKRKSLMDALAAAWAALQAHANGETR